MNLPAIKTQGTIDYSSASTVETIRQTVALGASDSELQMFVAFCQSTGLNPFKREIWFIKAGGRVQMMTGIHGFHAIANAHHQYDGIETGFVGKAGEYLPMTYPGSDFIGAWAKVYRKDRRIPLEGVAMLSEYDKGSGNWKAMRRVMIVKCAESVALRKAFPQQLNGLYTEDEYDAIETVEPPHPLDSLPERRTLPTTKSARPNETGGQSETRALMESGDSWMYGPGLIEVDDIERRKLWARLVRDHGAITDEDGIIHTNSSATEIHFATIGEPGRAAVSTGGEGR